MPCSSSPSSSCTPTRTGSDASITVPVVAASPVRALSGGNMQKVVLAREFSGNTPFLLVDQPTRGVDIGAMDGIHAEIMRRRDAGAAILLISVQLDEIRRLSDRVLVLFQGRIAGTFDPETASDDDIGLAMTGSAPARAA